MESSYEVYCYYYCLMSVFLIDVDMFSDSILLCLKLDILYFPPPLSFFSVVYTFIKSILLFPPLLLGDLCYTGLLAISLLIDFLSSTFITSYTIPYFIR